MTANPFQPLLDRIKTLETDASSAGETRRTLINDHHILLGRHNLLVEHLAGIEDHFDQRLKQLDAQVDSSREHLIALGDAVDNNAWKHLANRMDTVEKRIPHDDAWAHVHRRITSMDERIIDKAKRLEVLESLRRSSVEELDVAKNRLVDQITDRERTLGDGLDARIKELEAKVEANKDNLAVLEDASAVGKENTTYFANRLEVVEQDSREQQAQITQTDDNVGHLNDRVVDLEEPPVTTVEALFAPSTFVTATDVVEEGDLVGLVTETPSGFAERQAKEIRQLLSANANLLRTAQETCDQRNALSQRAEALERDKAIDHLCIAGYRERTVEKDEAIADKDRRLENQLDLIARLREECGAAVIEKDEEIKQRDTANKLQFDAIQVLRNQAVTRGNIIREVTTSRDLYKEEREKMGRECQTMIDREHEWQEELDNVLEANTVLSRKLLELESVVAAHEEDVMIEANTHPALSRTMIQQERRHEALTLAARQFVEQFEGDFVEEDELVDEPVMRGPNLLEHYQRLQSALRVGTAPELPIDQNVHFHSTLHEHIDGTVTRLSSRTPLTDAALKQHVVLDAKEYVEGKTLTDADRARHDEIIEGLRVLKEEITETRTDDNPSRTSMGRTPPQ